MLSGSNLEETRMTQPSNNRIVTFLETDSNQNQPFDVSCLQFRNYGYVPHSHFEFHSSSWYDTNLVSKQFNSLSQNPFLMYNANLQDSKNVDR